ncbi:hypothetical protein PG991_006385 [Apiospora marii]|uniref:SSCRP protein n=1 Tax=Apiospora marii TaxID=335849 RepID=A0ABR1SBX1_9PEZI
MRSFIAALSTAVLAPILGLAAPTGHDGLIVRGENLCNLKAPPALCEPDASVTAEETAQRAYNFYKAFVVDGDPAAMFSYIDNSYIQHHPGYGSGPAVIWPLFCSGNPAGSAANSAWCFDASTNMSYARYSTVDRWRWVGGCVHEHWDMNEKLPSADKCFKLDTTLKAMA